MPVSRNQAFPPSERQYGPIRPTATPSIPIQPASASAAAAPVPAPTPPGFVDATQAGEVPSYGDPATSEPAPPWAASTPSYSDPLTPSRPPGIEQARPAVPHTEQGVPAAQEAGARRSDDPDEPGIGLNRDGRFPSVGTRPDSLGSYDLGNGGSARDGGDAGRGSGGSPRENGENGPSRYAPDPPGPRLYDFPTSISAPPFPYEGDLDAADPPQAAQRRAAVPLVRRPTSGRRADWAAADQGQESARHGLGANPSCSTSPSDDPRPIRPSYDPSSFPRRVSYGSALAAAPAGHVPPGVYGAFDNRPSSGAVRLFGVDTRGVGPDRDASASR